MISISYATVDDFINSPIHGIDYRRLLPTADETANRAALQTILDTASDMVDNECNVDTLMRTQDTITVEVHTNPRTGELHVVPRNIPLVSVDTLQYRVLPSQAWATIDSSFVETYKREFVVKSPMFTMSLVAGMPILDGFASTWYRTPGELGRMGRVPITLKYTYTSGYSTNEMPAAVKMATVAYACSLIGERGNAGVDMSGVPSVGGGSVPRLSYEVYAQKLLAQYKKMALS